MFPETPPVHRDPHTTSWESHPILHKANHRLTFCKVKLTSSWKKYLSHPNTQNKVNLHQHINSTKHHTYPCIFALSNPIFRLTHTQQRIPWILPCQELEEEEEEEERRGGKKSTSPIRRNKKQKQKNNVLNFFVFVLAAQLLLSSQAKLEEQRKHFPCMSPSVFAFSIGLSNLAKPSLDLWMIGQLVGFPNGSQLFALSLGHYGKTEPIKAIASQNHPTGFPSLSSGSKSTTCSKGVIHCFRLRRRTIKTFVQGERESQHP